MNYGGIMMRLALWQSAYDRATDYADMAICMASIGEYTNALREMEAKPLTLASILEQQFSSLGFA
jgi:hypothetical protein